MIDVQPYDDHGAMAVFRNLDPHDVIEAEVMRGQPSSHLALWADWRAMRPSWVASYVLRTGRPRSATGTPFAVVALGNTGQCGVAQGAFLARSHQEFRGPMARAAVTIRHQMPILCEQLGIHRIEARCHIGHPTAVGFLRSIGFELDCVMNGFGPDGQATFLQYAFLSPALETET